MKIWLALCTAVTLSTTALSPLSAFAAVTPQDLNTYIQQSGLNQQQLTNYLADYGLTLNDFSSLSDLQQYLGQPLTAQTLPSVLNDLGISYAQLDQLLSANGMTLKDYQFVNELKSDVILFKAQQDLGTFMKDVGLTSDEVQNLRTHFAKLDLNQIAPQAQAITQQLNTLDFNSTGHLSAQDQTTLTNAFQTLLQLAQIKPIVYMKNGSQTQPLSLNDLFNLQPPNGATFIVQLNDLNGQKLADLTINPAQLNSDLIDSATQLMSSIQQMVNQTINGGQLPNTATHTWEFLSIGLLLLLLGAGFFKWNLKKSSTV